MHVTKTKGDIGVAFVIARLTELNFAVSIPLSEHNKYDLIIEKNGVCKTVQVRYTTLKNELLVVRLFATWSAKNKTHVRTRQYGDYDILAVFEPTTKTVFFISNEKLSSLKRSISFRFRKPNGVNDKPYRLIEDYLLPS